MAEAATLGPQAATGVRLDDLMLAMDVVDTLRHQEAFVARELDDESRERELTERLRKIYRDQGIEVPDAVIAEGVKALKDSRFVYTPPGSGLAVALARAWIARGRIGVWLAGGLAALALLSAGWYAMVVRPARIDAERARIELSTTLPKSLEAAFADAFAEAKQPAARTKADELVADGRRALAKSDAAGAQAAVAALTALSAELRLTYQLMIVSRPGEPSGIYRIPDRNTAARNYYLIVEAIGADGRPIELPVRNEETGTIEKVSKWGVRVDRATYDRVGADKNDDGVIQNRKIGEKKRGFLDVNYTVPTSGAAITRW